MKKINKIIFWTSIIFIGLLIIVPLILLIFDLEFASDSIKSNYKGFMFFTVPIAILLTLFGTIKSKDNILKTIGKVIGTILISFVTIFLMIMSIFADMCAWTDRQILYENKHDSNTKIIERDFGCGATDSGYPTVRIFKVQHFTKYFIRTTKVDTASIDKNEWIKIE